MSSASEDSDWIALVVPHLSDAAIDALHNHPQLNDQDSWGYMRAKFPSESSALELKFGLPPWDRVGGQ